MCLLLELAGQAGGWPALSRSGYAIVATGLQRCLSEEGGELDGIDKAKMEKLFLALA